MGDKPTVSVTGNPIRRVDCHMHTPLCGHAVGEPQAYVRQAAFLGIDLITFTCHIPMQEEMFGQRGTRMRFEDLEDYFAMIARARALGESLGVQVLCGIEAEIFPNEEIMKRMDDTLAAADFDFVLGSLHAGLPGYRQWLKDHKRLSDDDIVKTYFEHLGDGLESRRYDSIAHPDVIRLYGVITHFAPERYEPEIRTFLQRAKTEDHCLEINTSGLIKGDYVVHPDPLILDWASEIGNRFTLGSDSHRPDSVGQKFPDVLALLREKGIVETCFYQSRQRQKIPLPED